MKDKIKLIIVFVLGIMISVVISVYAATVISAGEVSYTDNKGIGASNVQDAINGVYTSANTLASNITLKNGTVTASSNVSSVGGVRYIYNSSVHVITFTATLSNTITGSTTADVYISPKPNATIESVYAVTTNGIVLDSWISSSGQVCLRAFAGGSLASGTKVKILIVF